MDRLVDLGTGAVVGRNDQGAFRSLGVLLRDGRYALPVAFHLMDAALPLQAGKRLANVAPGQLLNGLLQLGVFLAHDLLQPNRAHAALLHLGEDAAGLDGLMLPGVAHQQNAVFRMKAADELMHLPGRGQ